jgi:hypothetical protein
MSRGRAAKPDEASTVSMWAASLSRTDLTKRIRAFQSGRGKLITERKTPAMERDKAVLLSGIVLASSGAISKGTIPTDSANEAE